MLEIRSLVKVYPGPVAALQGVDLHIPKGMFGLLGPNGAGKTTLMRILAGLLEPTSGQVLMGGVDITKSPEHVWSRLGYLPQSFGFYPNLTGEAMLLHLLKLKGVTAKSDQKRLCTELLERVNLGFAATRKLKGYSGGMRQRLGIAQAIAGNPELIIVDEPTAGLDPEERLRFYRILAELAEERTVLLSTHIVEDVAVLCPQFAVIRDGRLIATTTPSQARSELAGKIYQGVVSQEDLDQLHSQQTVTQAYLVEGKNQVRLFSDNGTPPAGFEAVEPTLEDSYLMMMRARSSGSTAAAEPVVETAP